MARTLIKAAAVTDTARAATWPHTTPLTWTRPLVPDSRAPQGWVAVVLEKAAVITIDRSRPARIRLCQAGEPMKSAEGTRTSRSDEHVHAELLVKLCTKRFRGNAGYVATGVITIRADALSAAKANIYPKCDDA
jgi:hypothetical protein